MDDFLFMSYCQRLNCFCFCLIVNSPKLGASIVTEVIIEANDDANGILQLSSSAVAVNEGTANFLNVTRTRGSFGQV